MVGNRGGESQMYLTQSNVIRGLSKQEYTMLREMCKYSANADINGAANILRKSKQNFDFEGLCKGLLDSSLRIRLS